MGVTAIPYDSNGNFSLVPGYLAVSGQTILASQHNPPFEDVAASLSQVLLRSGAAPMSGNLSAAGYKITGAAAGTADGDYVIYSQLQDATSSLGVPTGAVQGFRRTSAPTGWVKENGGTIGNAASGATTRANADTSALFTLLWEQFSNTILPIQTSTGTASTRGGSAAADYAANKRLPLFDSRSRFLRGSDDGLAFDVTLTVGANQADAIKNHQHPGTTENDTHSHFVAASSSGGSAYDYGENLNVDTVPSARADRANTSDDTHNHSFTTNNNTGGIALETRPRSSVVLVCIKL